jgi:hypothetical protein
MDFTNTPKNHSENDKNKWDYYFWWFFLLLFLFKYMYGSLSCLELPSGSDLGLPKAIQSGLRVWPIPSFIHRQQSLID